VANELILVVEDHDKNRKLVRDVLTFKGYEIIEAETGEEGVRLAQERHPSLVLMDIRLPGIDGIEALRQLRAEQATRGIPIMAMTASVMTADRQKITDAGFDAFQSNPLKVSDFVAAVEAPRPSGKMRSGATPSSRALFADLEEFATTTVGTARWSPMPRSPRGTVTCSRWRACVGWCLSGGSRPWMLSWICCVWPFSRSTR
jgi:two-component system cell cycle response regulator DivK